MVIQDRVKAFLDSWPVIKEQLEGEEDGDELFNGTRDSEVSEACRDHGLQACRVKRPSRI